MNVEDPQSADLHSAGCASATSAARFAEQLRALRAQAGNPSYRHLARVMHYSPSTIADATAGRRLPTEPVVRALATACGADPDLWADRLREAAQAQAGGAAASEPIRGGESPGGAAHADHDEEVGQPPADRAGGGWWSSKTARWALAGLGAVALLFAGYGVGLATARKSPPKTVVVTAAPKPTYPAFDGADPAAAGCAADEQLLDKAPVMLNGVQVGAVDLKYSVRCGAGWARVYLYPAYAAKLTGTLASVSVVAADGTTMSIAARLDLQVPNYTNVVAPHGGCLRAIAVLGPDTAKPAHAQTACDPPPTSSKH